MIFKKTILSFLSSIVISAPSTAIFSNNSYDNTIIIEANDTNKNLKKDKYFLNSYENEKTKKTIINEGYNNISRFGISDLRDKEFLETNMVGNIDQAHGLYLDNDGTSNPFTGQIIEKNFDPELDQWYHFSISELNIKYLDYSLSKEDFIQKYKKIYFVIYLMDNFWDQNNGWTWSGGSNRGGSPPNLYEIIAPIYKSLFNTVEFNLIPGRWSDGDYFNIWSNSSNDKKQFSNVKVYIYWDTNRKIVTLETVLSLKLSQYPYYRKSAAIIKTFGPGFKFIR